MISNIIKILSKYGDIYLLGVWDTIWISFVAVFIGAILGVFIALGKMSSNKVLKGLIGAYVEILRGTPMLLQFYFFWLVLPKIFPSISDLVCVLIAMIINCSAYIAEVIRAGIQAVDPGQREAAVSLGMKNSDIMFRIILPQAIKNILPALGNEFVVMIKETSLASVFFIGELMTAYKTVQSATFLAVEALTISGVCYLILTLLLTRGLQILERRLKSNER